MLLASATIPPERNSEILSKSASEKLGRRFSDLLKAVSAGRRRGQTENVRTAR